jgi:O-Antigen ligase
VRLVTYILVWLALTAEVDGEVFSGKWETPLTWLGTFIFKPLPVIKAPIWDIAVLVALAVALGHPRASKNRAPAMVKSMRVALISIGALWAWGIVRGGDIRQTMWQLHSFVIAVVLAFLIGATCRTTAHVRALGKVVAFAAVYRAFVLIVFYFIVARGLNPPLQTLTTHADSALFVTGMLLFIVNFLERRSVRTFAWMVLGCIPLALAIKWNNRRLAWLSLIIGIAIAYVLLPRTRFKRNVNMVLVAAVPLIIAYVVVGWGHTDGIFKPVGAISTMVGSHADTSSEMRDIENYNLLQTLRSNPLLGLGWGHEYNELSVAISIKEFFPQYRFIPHNSVLGLLAFSGVVGFLCTWQLFVVTGYIHALSVRLAKSPTLRAAGILGVATVATFIVQMWGDMGWNTLSADVLMAAAAGVALRLPILAQSH